MTDEVAKLAGKTEAVVAAYESAGFDETRCELIAQVVRDELAAKDAEIARLREAATDAKIVLTSAAMASAHLGRNAASKLQRETANKLAAALQQGESHDG